MGVVLLNNIAMIKDAFQKFYPVGMLYLLQNCNNTISVH